MPQALRPTLKATEPRGVNLEAPSLQDFRSYILLDARSSAPPIGVAVGRLLQGIGCDKASRPSNPSPLSSNVVPPPVRSSFRQVVFNIFQPFSTVFNLFSKAPSFSSGKFKLEARPGNMGAHVPSRLDVRHTDRRPIVAHPGNQTPPGGQK